MSDRFCDDWAMGTNTKPAMLSIVRAGELLGLSRTATYAAAGTGELAPGVPVIRVGRRKLMVPTVAVEGAVGMDVSALLNTPPTAPAV